MARQSEKTDRNRLKKRLRVQDRDGCAFGPKDISEMVPKHRGTYALVFQCPAPLQVVAGKLGSIFLSTGYWIYVGSAFGSGGLRSRLNHHLKPSRRPHWHLDHIKGAMHPVEIWTTTDAVKREHDWAMASSALKGSSRPIANFGATDCACRAHLIHLPRRPRFSCFNKRLGSLIPAHGPVSRFDLENMHGHCVK